MKYNKTTLLLGTIAGIVSAWGFLVILTANGAPWYVAILGTVVIEGFALGIGNHAITVARDGDDSRPYMFIAAGIAAIAAGIQLLGAITEGKDIVSGILLAMAPIAAITLWTLEVSRHNRVHDRRTGRIASEPPARIGTDMRKMFPDAAEYAQRLAFMDRELTADDAMTEALNTVGTDPAPAVRTGKKSRGIKLNALTKPAVVTVEEVTDDKKENAAKATAPAKAIERANGATRQPFTVSAAPKRR
jgi:hypothetical protein